MRYVQFTYPVILLTALLTSCFPVEHEMEEGNVDNKTHSNIRLITRAADGGTFDTPIYAYGFNAENGSLIISRQLSSDDFSLSLPQHTDIRIVIISDDPEMYDIPTAHRSHPSLQ